MMVKLKVINKSNNPLPKYQTEGSAGMDIAAYVAEPVTLKTLERKLIPTGLYFEIPEGHEVQIRPRSGMALKNGVTVLNSPGTIDSDYRGEVSILLINLSDIPFTIANGDRIAQMVVSKVIQVEIETTQSLSDTQRGEGGYGSTGKV